MVAVMEGPGWAKPQGDAAAQLLLRSVERELFSRVVTLGAAADATSSSSGGSSAGAGAPSTAAASASLNLVEVKALEKVLDLYRVAVSQFLATPAAGAVMRAEQLSREVLVVWAAYCLTHAAAGRMPLVLQYGVLGKRPWEELRHLVLGDREAVDAALAVAAYLQRAALRSGGRVLFSLEDGGAATVAFAREFASTSPRLVGILAQEEADAEARVRAHWAEVRRKQQLAAQYRQELQQLEGEGVCLDAEQKRLQAELQALAAAQLAAICRRSRSLALSDPATGDGHRVKLRHQEQETHRLMQRNYAKQQAVKARLAEAETPPPAVIQPLPDPATCRGDALAWLFFLHMPSLLRRLSRLSFLAQQMLLPHPCSDHPDVVQALNVPGLNTSITNHYNTYSFCPQYGLTPTQRIRGQDGAVLLRSAGSAPSDVGPRHIDHFHTPSDGVWYPGADMRMAMAWKGSGCAADVGLQLPSGYFNPWALPAGQQWLVTKRFTEQLKEGEGSRGAASLQWAMPLYGSAEQTHATRGNTGIARQDLRPDWLSKPAFLELTSLRAYPLRQLHRLCAALRQRTLPLAHPAVQTLVRQLLYHIGPVVTVPKCEGGEGPDKPQLQWREGWDRDHDVLPTLCAELAALAEELDPAPRDQPAVLLLGEMAAYLSDWYEPCRTVARRFAAMTSRVADELEARVAAAVGAADGVLVAQLRVKQVRWRVMAMVCYGAGRLDAEDVGQLLQLVVLVHHGCLFQEGQAAQAELQLLATRAHGVMAARARDVKPLLWLKSLTAAAARVLQRIPATGDLRWELVPRYAPAVTDTGCSSNCYDWCCGVQAVSPDGDLYSINVLDGTVLCNGRHPGRLPREATEHPLFVRTFGAGVNFEVSITREGVMQTLQPVAGRHYDFFLSSAGTGGTQAGQQQQLAVLELDVSAVGAREGAAGARQQGEGRGKAGAGARHGAAASGVVLELLDVDGRAACTYRKDALPVRLRKMYSHWLSRDHGVILLRPPHFQSHDVHYIISFDKANLPVQTATSSGGSRASALATQYDCRRVPQHLRSRPWRQLLVTAAQAQLTDSLVLCRSTSQSAPQGATSSPLLSKFEDPCFTHTYIRRTAAVPAPGGGAGRGAAGGSSSGTEQRLVLELPRYELEFELVDGRLVSCDYSGYCLRRCQQLVGAVDRPWQQHQQQQHNAAGAQAQSQQQQGQGHVDVKEVSYTLPNFQQYLVLERMPGQGVELGARRGDVLVLVPAGEVVLPAARGDQLVRVHTPVDCAAKLKVHCYELHGRFGHLVAPSVPARLQLAALYAATSTLLPEPLSACTGAQTALRLVRQCWGNGPMAPEDLAQLRSIGALSRNLLPALPLLIHELELSAWQLHELVIALRGGSAEAAAVGANTTGAVEVVAAAGPPAAPLLDPDAATSYLLARQGCGGGGHGGGAAGCSGEVCGWGPNPRELLTPGEEWRVLGLGGPWEGEPAWRRMGPYKAVELTDGEVDGTQDPQGQGQRQGLGQLPVPAGYVETTEARLAELVVGVARVAEEEGSGEQVQAAGARGAAATPPYLRLTTSTATSGAAADGTASVSAPGGGGGPTPLDAEMHVELADSCRHVRRTEVSLAEVIAEVMVAMARAAKQKGSGKQIQGAGTSGAVATPPYPLHATRTAGSAAAAEPPAAAVGASGGGGPTPLEAEMHAELAGCWRQHQQLLAAGRQGVAPGAARTIREIQATTTRHREALEAFIARFLCHVPHASGCHAAAFRLARLAGAVPRPGPLDLVPAAWDPHQLARLNPFLSGAAQAKLHDGVLLWLQLCVLEDRLGRLVALAGAGPEYKEQLVQELLVRREWDVAQHPQWLAFEAEGRLQIRPQQYAVARHLMSNPGAIVQLNMGEGKTRVILPMLALHWADGSRLVRLHFLSQLLDEAHAHLHATLCASVLGRKLVRLPFHRDVELTPEGAERLLACLTHCMHEGGLLLVAPEHRLSMQLKWHELRARGHTDAAAAAVAAHLDNVQHLPYLDLMDESDELLHHRLQLIYACGSSQPLPALPERVAAVQALLAAVHRLAPATCSPFGLLGPHAAVLERGQGKPGSWCGLRLLPGEALGREVLAALRQDLAQELLHWPTHELEWLNYHPDKEQILTCITCAEADAGPLMPPNLLPERGSLLLALRGLLACDVLTHSLAKRHLVDYGVNRRPTARKRLAVPYRAAHTPSERSEFAQPDVALLLTHLSYYNDGLSYDELRTALETLLRMGPNAREAFFAGWLKAAAEGGGIDEEDLKTFDSVAKLDPTSPEQLATMHAHLSHTMPVVNFWLAFCVLPSETKQFPQRLAASAWHLAHNPSGGPVVGFSGTNDNHRLLPLQVRQHVLPYPQLAATNGRMLQVLLDCTAEVHVLEPQVGEAPWRAVLRRATTRGLHALLDCGALLAGASNGDAARFVLPLLEPCRFKGVCYHDTTSRAWVVLDRTGRTLPLHASPVAERETFVLYDDARCRGANLRLLPRAVALLTLGPGLCKDKLMQAAGRMRQLGKGQTLEMVCLPEVGEKIRPPGGMGAADAGQVVERQQRVQGCSVEAVLQWVMGNTVAATEAGLLPWATQGLHFSASYGRPERAVQDELLDLEEMYGSSKAPRLVGEVVSDMVRAKWGMSSSTGGRSGGAHTVGTDNAGEAYEMRLVRRIGSCALKYGQGYYVVAGSTAGNEECERELEQEEEQEQEVERQLPAMQPRAEVDWEYGAVLGARSVAELLRKAAGLQCLSLGTFAGSLGLASIPWPARVYCTTNFMRAVGGCASAIIAATGNYLRPVDAVLLFWGGGGGGAAAAAAGAARAGGEGGTRGAAVAGGSGGGAGREVLLVSEREADRLLDTMRRAARDCERWLVEGGAEHQAIFAALKVLEGPTLTNVAYLYDAAGGVPAVATSGGVAARGADGGSCVPLAFGSGPGLTARNAAIIKELLGAPCGTVPVPGDAAMVCVRLFNGEACYAGEGQRAALRGLVVGRRADVEALVGMRGKGELLPRSDLEDACGGP